MFFERPLVHLLGCKCGKSSGKQAGVQRSAEAAGTGQRVVFEDIHGVGSMHGAYTGMELEGWRMEEDVSLWYPL